MQCLVMCFCLLHYCIFALFCCALRLCLRLAWHAYLPVHVGRAGPGPCHRYTCTEWRPPPLGAGLCRPLLSCVLLFAAYYHCFWLCLVFCWLFNFLIGVHFLWLVVALVVVAIVIAIGVRAVALIAVLVVLRRQQRRRQRLLKM